MEKSLSKELKLFHSCYNVKIVIRGNPGLSYKYLIEAMKKLVKSLFLFFVLLIIFFTGFYIGNKLGLTTGAQLYTKKLWKNNYSQISANYITNLINKERLKRGIKELTYNKEVCKTADKIAELVYKTAYERYYSKRIKNPNTASKITDKEIKKIFDKYCKNTCPGNKYALLQYVSLRPETCSNLEKIKVCNGDEEFGLLENYPERVVQKFKSLNTENNNIYLNSKYSCVGTYGGTVVLLQVGL